MTFGAVGMLLLSGVTLWGQTPAQKDKANPAYEQNVKQGPALPTLSDPVPLKTKEGKVGWKMVIPGNRPLATPAIADGRVFIGAGFGSHEFYCFDAKTGKKVWVHQTGDDGPTAAVIDGEYIAFNTESCELEILAFDGKSVWKKRLGDPLMSMPAISKGRVYMAYPGKGGHNIACFDIKKGTELWTAPIAGEIITAPVIQSGQIFLTTLEGTVYCFDEKEGKLVWSEKKDATSSPAVFQGKVFFSQRTAAKVKDKDGKDATQQLEYLSCRINAKDGTTTTFQATEHRADYLDYAKRQANSKMEQLNKGADVGVGFATSPADAKLYQAVGNLGQGTVCGVWSYQGSRPFVYKEQLISTMGDTVKCVSIKDAKVVWSKELHPRKENEPRVDSGVTPPAIVNGKLFVGTSRGEVICLSAADGKELWRATVGEPIVFQPAVAGGRVYVSSSNGSLFCLETGDPADDGWLMWGGNAQHNGVPQKD
jgi:outer membrane protein assembly factor BamB